MADPGAERRLVVSLAVVVEGGLVGLAWLLGWLLDQPPLATFHWDGGDALAGALATLPPLLLFFVCMCWPIGPLGRVKRFTEDVLRPLLAPCSLLDLLGIAVLAGLGEEMVFRGVLQPVFERWTGSVWFGLGVAAVLFGLLHAVTAAYAVLAAGMGVYLGWLAVYRDNLLTPVLVHALYDFAVLLYLVYGVGAAPTAGAPPPGPEEEAERPDDEPPDVGGRGASAP
jgi:membrane protease YdiL (CAAX protease family)